jgi:hypothetical protein
VRTTRITRLLLVGAAALGLAVATAGPASASSADQRLDVAMRHVASGTSTSADLAVIRQHPDVARQVPDPAGLRLVTRTTVARTPIGVAPTVVGNYYTESYYTQLSTLGNVLYNWHLHITFTADVPWNVTAVPAGPNDRYDWITDASSVVFLREVTLNVATAVPAAWSKVSYQRRIEYCVVKYGCYANTYPHADVTIYGNATVAWAGAPA